MNLLQIKTVVTYLTITAFAVLLSLFTVVISRPIVVEAQTAPAICFEANGASLRQIACPDAEAVTGLNSYLPRTCYRINSNPVNGSQSATTISCGADKDIRCFSDQQTNNRTNCPTQGVNGTRVLSAANGSCFYVDTNEFTGGNVSRVDCPVDEGETGDSSGLLPPEDNGERRTCEESEVTGAQEGICVDAFTRCADGSYGVQRSGTNDAEGCIPFNPNEVQELEDNPILVFMGQIITFLTGIIGIILTMLLIVAGMRYTLARGNPQESAAAKSMIEKVVISVFMYLFAFALINWLIPGGLL